MVNEVSLWELAWKSIWLLVVALPLWLAGHMDQPTWETAAECLLAVIIPFVIPWRYVFAHYLMKPGARWR